MYQKAFERFFAEYISAGCGKDLALELAERDAQEQQDRYVDEKLEDWKLGE